MAEETVQVKGRDFYFNVTADLGKTSTCKGCGELICWATTRKGKKMPINKGGNGEFVSHFENCTKADEFRRKK